MIASPNFVTMIYGGNGSVFNLTGPPGSAEIEAVMQEFYDDQDLPYMAMPLDGRSDYAGFIRHNIPVGGIFTGAEGFKTEEEAALFGGVAGIAYDPNYHQAGDNITNLALDQFLLNSQASAYAVGTFALSTDSLPERNVSLKASKKFNVRVSSRSGSGSHM
jgi:carboxypeptidase Q